MQLIRTQTQGEKMLHKSQFVHVISTFDGYTKVWISCGLAVKNSVSEKSLNVNEESQFLSRP